MEVKRENVEVSIFTITFNKGEDNEVEFEPSKLSSAELSFLASLRWECEEDVPSKYSRFYRFTATAFERPVALELEAHDPNSTKNDWRSISSLDDEDEALDECFAEEIEAAEKREEEKRVAAEEARKVAQAKYEEERKAAEACNTALVEKWAGYAKQTLANGGSHEEVRRVIIASGEDIGNPHPQITYNLRLRGLLPHNPKRAKV